MSDVVFEDIKLPDVLYFTRIMPSFGYYEIHEIKINYRYDDPDPKESFVSGSDKDTKQRFIFTKRLAEEKLFRDRDKALDYINQKKEEYKDVKVYSSNLEDY